MYLYFCLHVCVFMYVSLGKYVCACVLVYMYLCVFLQVYMCIYGDV
jgi:hypothetical protein